MGSRVSKIKRIPCLNHARTSPIVVPELCSQGPFCWYYVTIKRIKLYPVQYPFDHYYLPLIAERPVHRSYNEGGSGQSTVYVTLQKGNINFENEFSRTEKVDFLFCHPGLFAFGEFSFRPGPLSHVKVYQRNKTFDSNRHKISGFPLARERHCNYINTIYLWVARCANSSMMMGSWVSKIKRIPCINHAGTTQIVFSELCSLFDSQ